MSNISGFHGALFHLNKKVITEVPGNRNIDSLCLSGEWEVKLSHNFIKSCPFGSFLVISFDVIASPTHLVLWVNSSPLNISLLPSLLFIAPRGSPPTFSLANTLFLRLPALPWFHSPPPPVYPRSLKNTLRRNIPFRNDCTYCFPVLVHILDFFLPSSARWLCRYFISIQGSCHQVVKNRHFKHKSPQLASCWHSP